MLGIDVVKLTLLTNLMLVTAELLTLFYIVKWSVRAHSAITGKVLLSWALVSVGYLIRIGFWAVGVYFGGDKAYQECSMDLTDCVIKMAPYPAWAIEYRGWLIVSAALVAWGALMFIRHIEGFTFQTKCALFSMIVVVSTLPILI